MKMRLRGSTLRLRLSRGEIEQLKETGTVEEIVFFGRKPEEALRYQIRRERSASEIQASFRENCICIGVPSGLLEPWLSSEEVGFSKSLSVGEGKTLEVLVEKDFRCLIPRSAGEDGDGFPNPKAASEC